MTKETPQDSARVNGSYPFPSRKDIHGTRIPKASDPASVPSGSGWTGPTLRESIASSLGSSGQTSARKSQPEEVEQQPKSAPEAPVSPKKPAEKSARKPSTPVRRTSTSAKTANISLESAEAKPKAKGADSASSAVQAPATKHTSKDATPASDSQAAPAPASPANEPQSPSLQAQAAVRPPALPQPPLPVQGQAPGPGRPVVVRPGGAIPVSAQTAALKAKARKRNKAIRTTLILLLLLALAGTAIWFALNGLKREDIVAESNDYPGPGHGTVTVTVNPGDLGSDIGQTLKDAGVVKSVESFITAFENNTAAATIRPGNYTLKYEMSSAGALAAMLDEVNRQDNSVTVHAGQTLQQIKQNLVETAGFSMEEVEAALSSPEAIGLPAEAAGNPEGWLAPGSYERHADDTAAAVISKMVAKQVQTLTDLGSPQDQWMAVLIKASILEREAGNHIDLAKIARVIDNRLDFVTGETVGLLQMDSTVLYGVGKAGGMPTAEDLQNDNPWNTYLHKGLPPTPIASPSYEAVEATINPAEGSWLYFVTINLDTGETLFADTLAEQEANRQLLDQWCSDNPGKCY